MKIQINSSDNQFTMRVPGFLLCTKLGWKMFCQNANIQTSAYDEEFMRKNRRRVRQILKQYKGLELLNVEEADGSSIKIHI